MTNKQINIVAWSCLVVFVLWGTNCTIVGYLLKRNYSYSNYNGTFRYNEMKLKGFTYESRDRGYRHFLAQNPDIKDQQLYRTFTLDPWRFWEWNEWFKHFDRFTLPYISERKIQKNRELEGLNSDKAPE